MSPRNLSVTEPHPTVPSSGAYLMMGGRGGAGNYKRFAANEVTVGQTATGPASCAPLTRTTQRTVAAGRGGAGNMYRETEPAVFQFDEEMVRRREVQAPVYHIGRGGAANFIDETKPKNGRSGSSSSVSSSDSAASVRRSIEGAMGKLVRKISHQ